MFGNAKRSGKNKSRRTGFSDLTELQVWITSADPDCDAYPSVKSDESCEWPLPGSVALSNSLSLYEADLYLSCIKVEMTELKLKNTVMWGEKWVVGNVFHIGSTTTSAFRNLQSAIKYYTITP